MDWRRGKTTQVLADMKVSSALIPWFPTDQKEKKVSYQQKLACLQSQAAARFWGHSREPRLRWWRRRWGWWGLWSSEQRPPEPTLEGQPQQDTTVNNTTLPKLW